MSVTIETTVGELVAQRPARARVFETLGIDYCCGGKESLRSACGKRELDPKTVLTMLDIQESPASDRFCDVSALTLTELVDHIEATHHQYLRKELPRLRDLSRKVSAAHGSTHEEVTLIEQILEDFEAEIGEHMQKEEMVLFPAIRELDAGAEAVAMHCGGLEAPIRMMEFEHDNAGGVLATLRDASGQYKVPEDACNTFRAFYQALADLEEDMHQHVHKENNILFPKALAAQAQQE